MMPILIDQAEAMGAGSLDRRIRAWADAREYHRLVEVLNTMLGRIHRAFEAQKRFTADACHELRSPLTALRGEIELALRRERRPEEYRRVPKSNLEEVARGIVDRFRGAAADRDVDLSLRVEGDGVTSVDPGLLGQVICPSPSTASMPLAPHERGEEDEHGGAQARSHEARPKVAYGVNGG